MMQNLPRKSFLLSVFILVTFVASTNRLQAQDWVRTGTNLGVNKIRIAAADLKAVSADPQTGGLKSAFDQTLYTICATPGSSMWFRRA